MMLILLIGILFLFGVGYIYCLRNTPEWIKNIDKKEHKLYVLYPLSDFILTKIGLERILNRKDRITDSIKALYVTSKPELKQKLFWCRKLSLVIAILILFDLLSLIGQLQSTSNSIILNEKYIMRPNYGEGSTEVELKVTLEQTDDLKTTDKDVVQQSQDLIINVEERRYSQEEISKIFEEAKEYLEITVLGNNESADLIYSNLYFVRNIPGTSITIEWKPEDYNLVHTDGTINNEEIAAEGIATRVMAILTYSDQRMEHTISFHIMPKQEKEENRLIKKLQEEINTFAKESANENWLELPESIENYHLNWKGEDDNTRPTLFFFGVLMAILVWFYGDKELDKQMKKRKDQMLMDYPEIINKFTLLVNAGMTVKQAWNKIAEDYSIKTIIKSYAYEEMLTTAHELKLGLPESIAYEQYGRRIGLIPYIKFSSLITQNLKKGNKGFTELLMREAIEAFEDRKETAKRLGEEAGTKLLIPMMIMLILVFLIILIPAFSSFGI